MSVNGTTFKRKESSGRGVGKKFGSLVFFVCLWFFCYFSFVFSIYFEATLFSDLPLFFFTFCCYAEDYYFRKTAGFRRHCITINWQLVADPH